LKQVTTVSLQVNPVTVQNIQQIKTHENIQITSRSRYR